MFVKGSVIMGDNFLEITLESKDDKVKFVAGARSNPELVIDYFPPFGTADGYTSLELLLCSFASCVSYTSAIILRNQMKRTVTSINAKAKGLVKEDHPKALSMIELELFIDSPDTRDTDVEKTLAALESKLCPVWSMIKGNVEIEVKSAISR